MLNHYIAPEILLSLTPDKGSWQETCTCHYRNSTSYEDDCDKEDNPHCCMCNGCHQRFVWIWRPERIEYDSHLTYYIHGDKVLEVVEMFSIPTNRLIPELDALHD